MIIRQDIFYMRMTFSTIYLIIITTALATFPLSLNASDEKLFHIRYDIDTENGQFTGSRLTMTPADNEYRAEDFRLLKITGQSDILPETDSISSAKNNALKDLLISHGLKSISSKHGLFNMIASDKSMMSYEGLVKHPFHIIHEGYLEGQDKYRIEMEVWFSPVSFPDKWSYLYIKKKMKDAFSDMISVFR